MIFWKIDNNFHILSFDAKKGFTLLSIVTYLKINEKRISLHDFHQLIYSYCVNLFQFYSYTAIMQKVSNFEIRLRGRPKQKFKCTICSKDFSCNTTLRVHLESLHGILKPHLCIVCCKPFKTLLERKTHMKNDHKMNIFECQKCEKTFFIKGLW